MAVLLMVIACKESAVEQWIIRAEENMEVNADSAYRCLHHAMEANGWNDELRARYALRYTQAMHKCRIPLESDLLINTAVEYYANSNDRHRLALSLLYKGLAHKQNHQVEQAVEAFVASEQAFEGVEDNQYKALLFNHYGALLMNQGVYEEALVYYKESYRYKLLGDSLHYVVSACEQIANLYEIMEQMDSAKVYYERGLLYADNLNAKKRQYKDLLLHDYATFLIRCKEFGESERLLTECLTNMEDMSNLPTLYSALTTLYYVKGDLVKALFYGRQILGSDDSLTVCGGYLRLYNIYKSIGNMDSAVHYHDLYRQYHSDIVMRKQTAKVAAIPNRVKSSQLETENQTLTGWRLWLAIALGGVSVVAMVVYVCIKRKHSFEQAEKERELAESQTSLADTQNLLTQTKVDLGQTKGVLTHRTHAFDRMKQSLEEIKKKHQEEIKLLKEEIKKLKADIRDLKSNDRRRNHAEAELMQHVKSLDKQLKTQTKKLQQVECQREIDLRIEYFMASGWDSVAVDLLLQLRLNKKGTFKYDIRAREHLPLLKELLQRENPELLAQLVQCKLEENRMILCCLIALGLDDVDMMARAACLAPNSVKTYRKECRELLDSLTSYKLVAHH